MRRDGGSDGGQGPPRVTLIGKPGCHLCDTAREVVVAVTSRLGVGWQELSILDDAALAEQYREQIPVVLVDGEQHDYWRVDERRLSRALTGRSRLRSGRGLRWDHRGRWGRRLRLGR